MNLDASDMLLPQQMPSPQSTPAHDDGFLGLLRRILGVKDALALTRDIASEKLMPETSARRMGVLPHYERTKEMLNNPSVDSLMAVSGGAKPGVFWPATMWAGRAIDAGQKAGIKPTTVAQYMTRASETGFYNPVNHRVSFPAGLPSDQERNAAMAVAALKYAVERDDNREARQSDEIRRLHQQRLANTTASPDVPDDWTQQVVAAQAAIKNGRSGYTNAAKSYESDWKTAYNFLTESSRNPHVTMNDLSRLGGRAPDAPRIARQLLADPLFANHPLNKAHKPPSGS